jgi:hypothetical protein
MAITFVKGGIGMGYMPNLGGHAPGHLRDAFLEYLDGDLESEVVTIGYEGKVMPLRWLLGQLWNCTDTLPGEYCAELELTPGSTYAQAVRKIARQG